MTTKTTFDKLMEKQSKTSDNFEKCIAHARQNLQDAIKIWVETTQVLDVAVDERLKTKLWYESRYSNTIKPYTLKSMKMNEQGELVSVDMQEYGTSNHITMAAKFFYENCSSTFNDITYSIIDNLCGYFHYNKNEESDCYTLEEVLENIKTENF